MRCAQLFCCLLLGQRCCAAAAEQPLLRTFDVRRRLELEPARAMLTMSFEASTTVVEDVEVGRGPVLRPTPGLVSARLHESEVAARMRLRRLPRRCWAPAAAAPSPATRRALIVHRVPVRRQLRLAAPGRDPRRRARRARRHLGLHEPAATIAGESRRHRPRPNPAPTSVLVEASRIDVKYIRSH